MMKAVFIVTAITFIGVTFSKSTNNVKSKQSGGLQSSDILRTGSLDSQTTEGNPQRIQKLLADPSPDSIVKDKTREQPMPSNCTMYQGSSKSMDVDVMAIMNDCNDTFRIEMSYLASLNQSASFPDETDKTPKCFIRCVLEKTGVASEDGEFDAARAGVIFAGQRGGKTMDDVEDIAALCVNRLESCKCERSYNFLKCLMALEIDKYEYSE